MNKEKFGIYIMIISLVYLASTIVISLSLTDIIEEQSMVIDNQDASIHTLTDFIIYIQSSYTTSEWNMLMEGNHPMGNNTGDQ